MGGKGKLEAMKTDVISHASESVPEDQVINSHEVNLPELPIINDTNVCGLIENLPAENVIQG